MSYKLLLIETEEYYEYDGNCCDPGIEIRDLTLGELAKSNNYELKAELQNIVLQVLEDDDEGLRDVLRRKGWVNIKEIEDREQKLKAAKQYYMITDRQRFVAIDLINVPEYVVRQLAQEKVQVVQAITKPSLKKCLSAKQRKIYEHELARLKTAKEKKAATADDRRKKKAAKELEKARKVLEKAGELNGK